MNKKKQSVYVSIIKQYPSTKTNDAIMIHELTKQKQHVNKKSKTKI